ncbi:MAG: rocD2, partial [Thermoleophilia bacterium]|nr:rocD2 [Thermoleophilia bacterium]
LASATAGRAMSSELPGFALAGAPVFNSAEGSTMGAGQYPDATSVLDLAMVFGSRLWGHDAPVSSEAMGAAPGVGDLYTHELRERACAALCERVGAELHEPAEDFRALVLHTGSEAVETALKTALRATGRERIVAFEGGYHGTFGLALAVTHGEHFREPWAAQLPSTVRWDAWGEVRALDREVACVVVEPWQGRAGVVPPPPGFLELLREECDRVGAQLVLDAVLCGAGRTGATVAEAIAEARPDIVCLGKAIGAGVTASAVVMRARLAAKAWDRGAVEPAHTSTSVGEPFACAGILRALERLETHADVLASVAAAWRAELEPLAASTGLELRGTGLLWALDTGRTGGGFDLALRLRDEHRILVVPSGPTASSITLYPAAISTDLERGRFVEAVTTVVS